MDLRTPVFAAALSAALAASAAYDVKPSAIVPEWTGAEPGVWTMDYVAATNAAAASDRWTLMQFTGMWWCPHCQALEEGVLTTPAWSNWVDRVGTYLVAMDYPYRDGYSNFCWLWDEDYRQTKCGGMSAVEGTNTVYRRYAVQDALSTPGAQRQTVKLYDAEGTVTNTIEYGRVGHPTLLVVRPGGTVAGRFSVSKTYANLDYVTNRLEQTLLADAWDEPDNYWQTATELALPECDDAVIEHGVHTLSQVDTADWYRLDIAEMDGALWNFICAAADGLDGVPLKLEVFSDPTAKTPDFSEELTPGGLDTFSRVIAEGGTYWIKVTPVRSLQRIVGYSFSYSYSVAPATVSFAKDVVSVRSSMPSVSLKVDIAGADRDAEVIIDWRTEDLTATNGVDYLTDGGTLAWLSGEVKRTKSIEIPLLPSGVWKGDRAFDVKLYPRRHCVIPEEVDSCRVMIAEAVRRQPGTLSFDKDAVRDQQTVREGEPVAFEVSRTGGADGVVTGIVTVVAGSVTETVTNLVWAHGCDDTQVVLYAPEKTPDYIREDTKATLRLTAGGGARTGTSSARLLLRDELVEMTLAEYSRSEWEGALTSVGVGWFYGKTDPSSKENVLRSCPLEGESTALSCKVRGPAVVEIRATAHGAAELLLHLDRTGLTNGFPARVAVPSGWHAVVLSAEGGDGAFVEAGFRTASLVDYKLQADDPRDGRRLSVSEDLSLSSVYAAGAVESVEPGVSVVTRIGASSRLSDLPSSDADAPTTAGYVYPQNDEQRTALLDFAREHVGKTLQWRMDVRFEDDFGNVAEQAGVTARFIPLDEGAPCVDGTQKPPDGWTVDAVCAELQAPDMTVGVNEDAGPVALGNLSGGVASVTVKSGKLPPGIKAAVEDGAFYLVGVPTAAGTFVAEITVNEKVPEGNRMVSVAGCSYRLTVNVRTLDDVAATYDGYVTERMPDGSAEAGQGTATMTVSRNGKASGKFVREGKTLSFTASAWTARTNDTFYLDTTVRSGLEWLPVRVRVELADEVQENGDAQIDCDGTVYFLYANRWKTVGGAALIAPFVETYAGALVRTEGTAAAPCGTGYLLLSVRTDGTVVYSGANSLGKTFSGKATLFKAHDCCSMQGYYLGCYLYAIPSNARVSGSGLYGIVEVSEEESYNVLTCRGVNLVRDVDLDANSVYEGVAWTNVLDVVGGSVAPEGLPAGEAWSQAGPMSAFADFDGRDGESGYGLLSAPSNLVLSATTSAKASFGANDWNATIASFAKSTGITSFRFTLTYEGTNGGVKRRTVTAKGIHVPHSAYGTPFWAGYYAIPETTFRESGGRDVKMTVQTPFAWLFE